MDRFRRYHAKLLLFGEYTILDHGEALALPLNVYEASWDFSSNNHELKDFYHHLENLPFINQDSLKRLRQDSPAFESDIPRGYGLGSSAALTAGVYELLVDNKPSKLESILDQLARIEDFFHGKSSGLDALCIFLDKGIHFKANKQISVLDEPQVFSKCFLYDSGQERNAKAMIQIFLDKKKDPEFIGSLDLLKDYNKKVIQCLIDGNEEKGLEYILAISRLQIKDFREMIPQNILKIWNRGLETGDYFLKLSGAGGGGMFLGFGKIPVDEKLIYIS